MSFKSGRRPVMPISHYFSRYFYGVTRDVNRAKVRCKWAVFDFFPMMPFGPCPTPPGHRPYASVSILEEVSRSWYVLKKINIENKSIIVGIYERTCIRFSCFIQRTQDNLHVRLVQVVLKEALQDGTQRSLKISIACSTNGILKNETVTKISFFLTILF